jgi:uncharacterized protein with ATP-grasp and redox domains
MNSHCVDCLLKKHNATARSLGNDDAAYRLSKGVMQLILDAAPEESSAVVAARINKLYMDIFGMPQDRYREEKEMSNRFVLERLDTVREKVNQASDPVLTALQYAILGNYIDFSALWKDVSFEKLEQMLENPEQFAFDTAFYPEFCREMENAKNLLLITDNAGELGFDWVLADALQKRYPDVKISFCVRGFPAHNDATREDYEFMQIPFPVIDSGSDIGGTELSCIGQEARNAIENADVILAKGMGNTETLYGCGLPVYFAFLVKCKRLEQVFSAGHMTPMFVREPK